MSKRVIKVVSRDSALAMWQTNFVVDSLRKVTDQYEFEIVSLKTKGDKVLDVSLAKIGDKGLFTKEQYELNWQYGPNVWQGEPNQSGVIAQNLY